MEAETAEQARRRRSDGEQTYASILETAVRVASVEGLGALTLGRLAREVGVSKSGLYAHFGSKRRLQLDTIQAARRIFEQEVVAPGLSEVAGLARLRQLCESYLSYIERYVFPGGCFFAGMLAEFDAQSGIVHDEVARDQREWTQLLEWVIEQARGDDELDPKADGAQLVFEVTAAVQLANHYYVLTRDPTVIDRARTAIERAIARSARTSPVERPEGPPT